MKPFLIALLLSLLATACGPQKTNLTDEAPLAGSLQDGTYRNDFFRFQMAMPKGWEVASEEIRRKMEAELKAAHAQRPEVQLMLYREVEDASIPDVFVIAAQPYPNPTFSGVDDAYAFFRSGAGEGSEVLRRAYSARIGGVQFAREDMLHRGAGQFMAHHALAIRGHMLSLQVYSASRRRMEEVSREMAQAIEFSR